MGAPFRTVEARVARFWSRGRREGACLIWTGAKQSDGYGSVAWTGGAIRLVHQVAFELTYGPVPDGKELDHTCRNRPCFEPTHLEAVTHRENVLRGDGLPAKALAKTHCVHGHPFTAENTIYDKPKSGQGIGSRRCQICTRARWTRQNQQRASTNRREWEDNQTGA